MKLVKFLGLIIPLSSSIFMLYYLTRFFINPGYKVAIYESYRLVSGSEILLLIYGIGYIFYLIWNEK